MTNRDKFYSINNDVLADMLCVIGDGGARCKFCAYEKGSCFGKSCFDGIKRWLNFMTNRDEFNAMDNTELADILKQDFLGGKCKFCIYTSGDCFGKSCAAGIERWLNAPCANEPENPPADNVDKMKETRPLFVTYTAIYYVSGYYDDPPATNRIEGHALVKFPKPLATEEDFEELQNILKKELNESPSKVIINNFKRLEHPE